MAQGFFSLKGLAAAGMPTRKGSLLACSVQNCSRSAAALDTCRPAWSARTGLAACPLAQTRPCHPGPHLHALDARLHPQLLHGPAGLPDVAAGGPLAGHLQGSEQGHRPWAPFPTPSRTATRESPNRLLCPPLGTVGRGWRDPDPSGPHTSAEASG